MDSPSKSLLSVPALLLFLLVSSLSPSSLLFLLVSSLSPSSSAASADVSDTPTVYQMLEKYDFPRGILPEGAQSYGLREDGSFEVYLSGDCEFKVTGSYLLRYSKKVTGTVRPGTLTNLRGVSVRVVFLWFGVNEVVRSGDELRFSVGPLSATFALSRFEVCPRCRCGFNCATVANS